MLFFDQKEARLARQIIIGILALQRSFANKACESNTSLSINVRSDAWDHDIRLLDANRLALSWSMAHDQDQQEDGNRSPLFTPPSSPGLTDVQIAVRVKRQEPIPGLFYLDDVISEDEAEHLIDEIGACHYFDITNGRDQAVLFGSPDECATHRGLPSWASSLLTKLEKRLYDGREVARTALDAVFVGTCSRLQSIPPSLIARQLILNTYSPGQGIAAHVDLPHRFLDGIMILSLGSGIVMNFTHEHDGRSHSFYLTPRSLCILTGESRWRWKHGIAARTTDAISTDHGIRKISRGLRLSITVRWLHVQKEEDVRQEDLNTNLRV